MQNRYSSMVRNISKTNRKNEETSPRGIRACLTSLGGPSADNHSPKRRLSIERSSSCLNKLTRQLTPKKNLFVEGEKMLDNLEDEIIPNHVNNHTVIVPNRVILKPRINPERLRLVGKSLENVQSRKFGSSDDNDLNWGR